ncbi:helix-turn-helix domain-containing protein [Bacillus sp. AFS041924]|uniref:helix-turn-helix domain-containing protein n=1 Tax=Bacillus sp. AFS041924 TaxID=2033503 RepID=UPI000BFC6685|nr:helix-turn-helix transcriptional regulator [Bacillus sp. AFS041924]PGS51961.1 transcriptional regulator [Bacillus sp. AFS041924]
MYEGKIIKFYREKYKLTQEQLGKNICSVTHISKIECGQTKYAPEIINLLSKRLGIDMELEVANFMNIKQRLLHWHDVIIMQLFEEMNQINYEFEMEELIQISEYHDMYQLLRAKYFLTYNKCTEAFKIIKKIQKKEDKLAPYEQNLLKHILGIYYLAKQEYGKVIQTLKSIDHKVYKNPEFYYHLAVAYHTIKAPVLAYYYAEKSHLFFKQINNYLRVIDAEMLMIIQVQGDTLDEEIINRFKNLIRSCELCNAPDRKAKVLHNLAYEYYRGKNFKEASKYYKESMLLKDPECSSYLLSLEGYIRSSFEGNSSNLEELIHDAEVGLFTAKKNNYTLYVHLFKLLLYLLKSKEKEYYHYLNNRALPMFIKSGFTFLTERSKKELFNYYSKMNLNEQAMEIAQLIVNT